MRRWALAFVLACACGRSHGTDPIDAGGAGADAARPMRDAGMCTCVSDPDCPPGAMCRGCQCIAAMCTADADCPDGTICDSGVCGGCVSRSDCGPAEECVDGRCTERECNASNPCPVSYECRADRCIFVGECTSDT